MKLAILFLASLLALTCAAETKPPEPKAKETTVTRRATRVIVIAPRVPLRYYGYNLLGNVIGNSIVGAINAHRARVAEREAAYVPPIEQQQQAYVSGSVYEPPPLTELTVESNPPGARVVINAQSVGVTPQTRLEKPGAIYLLIRAEGYDDFIQEFKAAGEPVHITAELKPHQAQ